MILSYLVSGSLIYWPIQVRALVRDRKKAEENLDTSNPALEIVQCDLLSATQLQEACRDAAAAVWCATGFSDSQDSSLLSKLMGAFKLKFTPRQSVDILAMKAMSAAFKGSASPLGGPSIIMCSSAGVTRPTWAEEKKTRYPGAADIPIVRLNPLGILGYTHSFGRSPARAHTSTPRPHFIDHPPNNLSYLFFSCPSNYTDTYTETNTHAQTHTHTHRCEATGGGGAAEGRCQLRHSAAMRFKR